MKVLINPQTDRLRSGWRALLFVAILISPRFLFALLSSPDRSSATPVFEVNAAMIASYALLVAWVFGVSWGCLHWLDGERLSSLGLSFFPGWLREIGRGGAMGLAMVGAIVLLQMAGGGTRLTPNPFWWRHGHLDGAGLKTTLVEGALVFLLLLIAATFEELIYRGYAFQTLLRGAPAVVPLLLLSILFGLGHWENPHRTFFSTANTVLAGIWLSLAYLQSRNLWYPIALHLTWNWLLGPIFGLPISGMTLPAHPLLQASSESPLWLTGGSYGSEGGVAATAVLLGAIGWMGRKSMCRRAHEPRNF